MRSNRTLLPAAFQAVFIGFHLTCASAAEAFVKLDLPTPLMDCSSSGDQIVGTFGGGVGGGAYQGYIYDIADHSLAVLDMPGAGCTKLLAVRGTQILADPCSEGAQLYDETTKTWTPVYCGGSPADFFGRYIVGFYYVDQQGYFGTVSDFVAKTNAFLMAPHSSDTSFYGIYSNLVVGYSYDGRGYHGVIYDIRSHDWKTLDAPGSRSFTIASAIDSANIAGNYYGSIGGIAGNHAFIYNLKAKTWTTVDIPGAMYVYLNSIDGQNVVGTYSGLDHVLHPFLYKLQPHMELILSKSSVSILLTGAAFTSYEIESSSDCQSWQHLETIETDGSASAVITDQRTSESRYYLARTM
ncbi:MAG: hypothetical protein KGI45_01765 [Patescibacteria group bacterium]|nr:hypothetical protein [Patescibacteria group bacterium]MDE1966784.1 hypothetical protein [Patescibacteria group bacterium]